MKKGASSFVILSQAGCFLPFLITFNLFFGWMFLSKFRWLLLEAGLILIFIINGVIITRKIFSAAASSTSSSNPSPQRKGVIDVDAQIIDEDKKLS